MTSTIEPNPSAGLPAGTIRGMAWMLLTGILFIGVTGIVRYLGTDMNPVQAAFIRYAFGLLFVIPIFMRLSRKEIREAPLRLHILRGAVHGCGVMLWFFAMARIPIAEVTAIGYTAPIFTTIGAALFLGEKLRARRVAAVVIGFLGTMVILRPGLVEISIGAMAQLTAAPLFAASFLLAKKLTDTESPSSIIAYLSVFVTLALLPFAVAVRRPPTGQELLLLFATAVLATLGHYTLTRAFRSAEITVTQPVSFLQLVWASLLGLYAFGEEPDVWTWVGAAIIVGSATYIAHRETVRKGRAEPKFEQS